MIKICALEYYLPHKILTNAELEKEFPDWSAEKIEAKVGIKQRHVASNEESVLEMAVACSEKVLSSYDRDKIDFVLLCTQSPDYFLPTTSCILQDRLQLKKGIGALDYNLGCSGFVYGLALSKGLLQAGLASSVLLVMSETYTKHIDEQDKANRSIFGDAAAAAIIEIDSERSEMFFEFGTDGSGAENLMVKRGAFNSCSPVNPEHVFSADKLYMNGPEIFNFTIQNIPLLVSNTLQKNQMDIKEIDYFIFHQANAFMLNYLQRKIKIPKEKFYIGLESIGNTVSATIPIAIKDAKSSGKIKSGDKVLLAGFGVGYSMAATILTI